MLQVPSTPSNPHITQAIFPTSLSAKQKTYPVGGALITSLAYGIIGNGFVFWRDIITTFGTILPLFRNFTIIQKATPAVFALIGNINTYAKNSYIITTTCWASCVHIISPL
jgi:hypothetical protein